MGQFVFLNKLHARVHFSGRDNLQTKNNIETTEKITIKEAIREEKEQVLERTWTTFEGNGGKDTLSGI